MLRFSSLTDLRLDISAQIGDLHDLEEHRDDIVASIAQEIVDAAFEADIDFGSDDWQPVYDAIFGEDVWLETLDRRLDDLKDALDGRYGLGME